MNEESQTEEFETEELIESEELETEEQEEETEEQENEHEEVEYEGKQYKLPKELKEALLRQSDYTKKTMEVAEFRRQAEAERAQAQEQIALVSTYQKEFAQLAAIDADMERFKGIDWNALINESPADAMKLQIKYNEIQSAKNEVHGRIQQMQQEIAQKQQHETEIALQKAHYVLQKEIPNWGPSVQKQIVNTATSFGFDPAELAGITDPRVIKVLHAASKAIEKKTGFVPPKPIKGSSSTSVKDEDKMSDEEWQAWYEKKRSKGK